MGATPASIASFGADAAGVGPDGEGGGGDDRADDVELATLAWVHWHNTQRLHGFCGDVPPVEFEAAYAAQPTDQQLVGKQ